MDLLHLSDTRKISCRCYTIRVSKEYCDAGPVLEQNGHNFHRVTHLCVTGGIVSDKLRKMIAALITMEVAQAVIVGES